MFEYFEMKFVIQYFHKIQPLRSESHLQNPTSNGLENEVFLGPNIAQFEDLGQKLERSQILSQISSQISSQKCLGIFLGFYMERA